MNDSREAADVRLASHVLDSLIEGCVLVDRNYRYLHMNEAAARQARGSKSDFLGRTMLEKYPGIEHTALFALLERVMRERSAQSMETDYQRGDGPALWLQVRFEPVEQGVLLLSLDITKNKVDADTARNLAAHESVERARAEAELKLSEERYRSLVENLEDVVFSLDREGHVQYVSSSISKYGYMFEELRGQPFTRYVHGDDIEDVRRSFDRALQGSVESSTFRVLDKSGKIHNVRTAARVLMRDGRAVGVNGVLTDLTELKQTEDLLRSAQKMEAIGQLAGGVAHDFNNLMSVVLSYAGFINDALHESDPIRADVEEIRKAGARAVSLTRQLLAFSRKQVLEPHVIELNRTTADLEQLLQRVIGEDIELEKRLASDLGRVKADPGQIDQVIMNLVVNARDAMPRGGKLTIETANAELDESYVQRHVTVKAGSYVMIAISDTGCGMDEATQQHLFEPFFTTKEVGKGTGLGLSTVYGIIQQSGGHIWVYSEVGVGTTFKIYLPRVLDSVTPIAAGPDSERPAVGTESILLVEDDQAVRNLATRILRNAGYHVHSAANGGEALILCEANPHQISLLVTDVVMPQMSGKQLADRLLLLEPNLRVLYMSGYTDNAIERHGVLEPGTMFIGKPFSAKDLARKVRDVLDGKSAKIIYARANA